jgi:hypothetical protein
MAKLVVREGRNAGAEHPIPPDKQVFVLGRRSDGDAQVFDPQASRNHAEISRDGRRFMVRDLGSSNGTFYKNMKLKGKIELRPGSKFRIGNTVYEFLADPDEVPEDVLPFPGDALEIIPPSALEQQRSRSGTAVVASRQAVPMDGATPLPSQMPAMKHEAGGGQKKEPPDSQPAPAARRTPLPAARASTPAPKRVRDPGDPGTKELAAVRPSWGMKRMIVFGLGIPVFLFALFSAAVIAARHLNGGEEVQVDSSRQHFDDAAYGGADEFASRRGRRGGANSEADDARDDVDGRPRTTALAAREESVLTLDGREEAAERAGESAAAEDIALAEGALADALDADAADAAEETEAVEDEPEAEVRLTVGDVLDKRVKTIDLDTLDPVSREIRVFTGARTKVVWIQDQDRNNDTFATRDKLKLLGFDTDDGKAEREILPMVANFAQPMTTPKGDRILFTNVHEMAVYVVNWDGTGLKPLCKGVVAEAWMDPATGIEWAYVQTGDGSVGGDFKKNPIWRCQLDKPKIQELVWNKSGVDIVRYSSFQLSADGTHAGGAFPWNFCGVADLVKGTYQVRGRGCWASLAPDNSYLFWHFDGPHRNVYIYTPGKEEGRRVAINTFIECGPQHEVYHPRWSSNIRFMTLTGPYNSHGNPGFEEGAHVEAYLGRFNEDITEIEAWVKVSRNTRADFYPDAWIEPDSLPNGVKPVVAPPPLVAAVPEPTKSWPSDPGRLVYKWQDGQRGNLILDQFASAVRACDVKGVDRVFYGRYHDMELQGGTFVASEGHQGIAGGCRTTNEVSIQMVITPLEIEQQGTILSLWSDGGEDFAVRQEDERIVLYLKTSSNSFASPLQMCRLSDAEAHHLVISYKSGELFSSVDGRPASMTNLVKGTLAGWSAKNLLFGDQPQGGSTWKGSLKGVTVFARALTPKESKTDSAFWREKIDAREPVKRVKLRVKLVSASSIPDPNTIMPYSRCLIVNVYEVAEVVAGEYKGAEIAIAHWAILDRAVVADADREKTPADAVTVEPMDANPQLRSEMMVQDAGGYELPLYYEVGR